MPRIKRQPEGRVFQARETFWASVNGEQVLVRAGVTRVREGHPLIVGREQLFEPLTVHYDVEQATDAPGETRRRGASVTELTKVTYVRVGEGTTHPAGIYLNADDLFAYLQANDFLACADLVRAYEYAAETTDDDVVLGPVSA